MKKTCPDCSGNGIATETGHGYFLCLKCLGSGEVLDFPSSETEIKPTALTHSYSDLGGYEPYDKKK